MEQEGVTSGWGQEQHLAGNPGLSPKSCAGGGQSQGLHSLSSTVIVPSLAQVFLSKLRACQGEESVLPSMKQAAKHQASES